MLLRNGLTMNLSPKKVAILYIATGRYTVFWDYFYQSAESNLLRECKKHYFVFTDDKELLKKKTDQNISYISQDKLGWPYDTLMRFDIFLSIEDRLNTFDYIYFFNANTEILKPIDAQDILPIHQQNLVFAIQPHAFHRNKKKYTYDRNPNSTAYIAMNEGKYYFSGALNGGRAGAYLEMCRQLSRNTHIDLSNEQIALWHDESHLNKYALNRKDIKVLPPFFTRGENEIWKKKAKVIFSDKSHFRFGGHAYLRGETDVKISEKQWEVSKNAKHKGWGFRIKQRISSWFL